MQDTIGQGDSVERWNSGPRGFTSKANRQLGQLEQLVIQSPRQVVRPPVAPRPWLARITATAAMGSSDSRFVYTIEEVTLSITLAGSDIDGATVTIKGDGRTGKAINLAEMANEGAAGIAFSVDRAGTEYTATGYAPRPITGGGEDNTHKTDQVVQIIGSVRVGEGESAQTVYYFDRQGHHDGACEEEE